MKRIFVFMFFMFFMSVGTASANNTDSAIQLVEDIWATNGIAVVGPVPQSEAEATKMEQAFSFLKKCSDQEYFDRILRDIGFAVITSPLSKRGKIAAGIAATAAEIAIEYKSTHDGEELEEVQIFNLRRPEVRKVVLVDAFAELEAEFNLQDNDFGNFRSKDDAKFAELDAL